MATWNDYKNHVKETSPEINRDIHEAEALSQIIGTMIERRHELSLSQRDLAELCGIPHSSVARIESGASTPNLTTLLKLFDQLGLTIEIIRTPGQSSSFQNNPHSANLSNPPRD